MTDRAGDSDTIDTKTAVHFFPSNRDGDIVAPMTNPGCKGVLLGLGIDCKRAGGSTSLATISNKIVVASNKLYKRWVQLTEGRKKE